MDEALTSCKDKEKGSWKTFPYVLGGIAAVLMGTQGVQANLLVYLIQKFNMKSIDATQIVSVVNGCSQLAPIVGAIIGDAIGCFPVIFASIAASLMSVVMFMLSAAIPSLSPSSCSLDVCKDPTSSQLAFLYSAIFLLIIGVGGYRLNSSTFGANQMDTGDQQLTFFNWYTVATYVALIVGTTGLVYIQDNVSWVFGFSTCAALCAIGLLVFHMGRNHYRHSELRENPFLTLLRSFATRIGKKNVNSYESLEDGKPRDHDDPPKETEEAEILSCIIRLLPLMGSIIVISLAITIQGSLITLQAMVMDRHLGPTFQIPAASTPIFTMAAAAISIPLLEKLVFAKWNLTPLQRIGSSHFLTFVSLAASAVIEWIRLSSLESTTMSVFWLVPPMLIVGIGEALYFPSQLVFYFQEFPESLRSSSAGMTALMTGIGCYMSTMAISLIRRVTNWWQDDTDESRLDNVYWMLAAAVLINFGYFVVCAVLYKSKGKAKMLV